MEAAVTKGREERLPPNHVAIIMDGNGRWAAARDKPRWEGHRHGATRVRPIVEACKKRGVKALTIFAFSEQNWGRPDEEISLLMELLATFIHDEKQNLIDEKIRVVTIGEVERLPPQASRAIEDLVDATRDNDEFILAIALSEDATTVAITTSARPIHRPVSPSPTENVCKYTYINTCIGPSSDL